MPPPPGLLQRITTHIDALRHAFLHRKSTGALGERAAENMLKSKGYILLKRNLRNRFGEIDLVVLAPDKRTVVIVEVKSAKDPDALPELRVDLKKQHRLTALAAQLVRRYKLQDRPIRFDVVAVGLGLEPGAEQEPVIRHYPGAFQSHV